MMENQQSEWPEIENFLELKITEAGICSLI